MTDAYGITGDKMTLPISVIIPVYKQERWLDKAVVSAYTAQADKVMTRFDGDPYRMGVCAARNEMIWHAANDLILPLDADDRLYADSLQRLYNAWKPGTFVYGRYTEIDEDENVIREMDAPPPGMLHQKNLTYSTFLFHRDDWRRVGGYDVDFEPLEEDYALQCALVNVGVKPVRLDGAPIYKRMIHNNSRTARAMKYWHITQEMCRQKYPLVFS